MKYLCIDVGGTFVKYGVVDEAGRVLEKGKIPTPQEGFEAFVKAVAAVIGQYAGRVDKVTFSSLGHPEPDSGYVRGFSSLPYVRDRNFKKAFLDACGVQIEIENDANCAALAESWLGAGREAKTLVCIILGTSIGGGVVKDGQLHKGFRIGACETAGMLVNYLDGRYYTLQNTTAMSSLVADMKAVYGDTVKEEITGEWVFDRADAGDGICAQRVETYIRGLAVVIHNIIYFYDAQMVAVGGGISQRPGLIPRLKEILDEIAEQIGMDPVSQLVTTCTFNNDANLIGAARHAMLRRDIPWSYTLD